MSHPTDLRTTGAPSSPGVSVFIMTCDEEVNIRRCLDSVRWSDDVVVLDSFSRDGTVEIARGYPNVRVHQRAFDDFSSQRNHGLHQIGYRHDWLLVLDADEAVTTDLARELQEIASGRRPATCDVFLVRRKVFLDGRWVRHNTTSSFWIERFFRPAAVRYVGRVHEKLEFAGGFGLLAGWIEHHQFAKGVEHWLARRLQYARIEALTRPVVPGGRALLLLLRGHHLERRAALKSIYLRLPLRWAVYLVVNLMGRLAFLDGATGLRYVLLESWSQYLAARQQGAFDDSRTPQAH